VEPAEHRIWLILTVILTFCAGASAGRERMTLFWAFLALWLLLTILLAACRPSVRRGGR
jgi:hypothetical protein